MHFDSTLITTHNKKIEAHWELISSWHIHSYWALGPVIGLNLFTFHFSAYKLGLWFLEYHAQWSAFLFLYFLRGNMVYKKMVCLLPCYECNAAFFSFIYCSTIGFAHNLVKLNHNSIMCNHSLCYIMLDICLLWLMKFFGYAMLLQSGLWGSPRWLFGLMWFDFVLFVFFFSWST